MSGKKIAILGNTVQQSIKDKYESLGYNVLVYNPKEHNDSLKSFMKANGVEGYESLVVRSEKILSPAESVEIKQNAGNAGFIKENFDKIVPQKNAIRVGSGTNQFDLLVGHMDEKGAYLQNVPGNGTYSKGNSAAVAEKNYAELVDAIIRKETEKSISEAKVEDLADPQVKLAHNIFVSRKLEVAYEDVANGTPKKKNEYRGDEQVTSQQDIDSLNSGNLLRAKKVLLLANGSSSMITAELLKASGVEVYMYGRSFTKNMAKNQGMQYAGSKKSDLKPEMLSQMDGVIVGMPLNDHTKGFVDDSILTHLKDGAALINNARETIVDIQAASWDASAGTLYYYSDAKSPEVFKYKVKNNFASGTIGSETEQASGKDGKVVLGAIELIEAMEKGEIKNLVNVGVANSLKPEEISNIDNLETLAKYMQTIPQQPQFNALGEQDAWREQVSDKIVSYKEALIATRVQMGGGLVAEQDAKKDIDKLSITNPKEFISQAERLVEKNLNRDRESDTAIKR